MVIFLSIDVRFRRTGTAAKVAGAGFVRFSKVEEKSRTVPCLPATLTFFTLRESVSHGGLIQSSVGRLVPSGQATKNYKSAD